MMSKNRKILLLIFSILGLILAVLTMLILVAVGRTLNIQPIAPSLELFPSSSLKPSPIPTVALQRFTRIFGEAIKIPSVSKAPGDYDVDQIQRMHKLLQTSFPLVFNTSFIRIETVNQLSLLFTIEGTEPAHEPYMLCSHMDVVPVEPSEWSLPPFLGEVVPDPVTGESVIWGRGAIDDKSGVIGIMSAMELLIENYWKPKRSFFVAFGHDEEVHGNDGAGHIGKLLTERGVSLSFILDEGLPIIKDVLTGIDVPVAVIGVTEKGHMNVRVTARGEGGHSSIPPKNQAVAKLSRALAGLDKWGQPSMFGKGPEKDMLAYLAPKALWPHKLLFANLWLFSPIVSYAMSLQRESNAIQRTTTAITIVRAGVKENIVPASAWALINHRVHPGQSLQEVLEHDKWAVGDNVEVEMLEGVDPHPVSPYGKDAPFYQLISSAVNYAYPEAVVVPGLMIGNTDTFAYLNLTKAIYRLVPVVLTKETVATIHGKDERLTLKNFAAALEFYRCLILGADGGEFIVRAKKGREMGEL